MMDYKQMAEIVTKEVDAIIEQKKVRALRIKHISLTVSSFCAAAIIGLGIWHSNFAQKPLENLLPSDITVTTTADNNNTSSTTTTSTDSAISPEQHITTRGSLTTQTSVSTTPKYNTTMLSESKNSQTTSVMTIVTSSSVINNITTASTFTLPIVSSTASVRPSIPIMSTSTTATFIATTTTTDKNSYNFNISFFDDSTFEYVKNINAKLIQQKIEWTNTEHSVNVDEGKIVAEWNTSNANPYVSQLFSDNYKEFTYKVVVDNLPDNYTFYGINKVEQGVSGYLEGKIDVNILLKNEQLLEDLTPLNGIYSLRIKVVDKLKNIPVKGLNCELFNLQTGDIAARWNTSETEEMYIEGLEYSFDKPDSYNGNITYAIRITNLPDNYVFFYGKGRDKYGISGFGLIEFNEGTDIESIVYLEELLTNQQ